jgi:ComF family protein
MFIEALLTNIKDFILETLFPVVCVECQTEGAFLCESCLNKLKLVKYQQCIICRKPSAGGKTHPACLSKFAPEGLISIFDYHDPKLSKLIIDGKYNYIKSIYEFLGKLVAENLKKSDFINQNFRLVPIPLAPARHKWRGFNQAAILCQTISKQLNIPVAEVLIRHKATKTQKELNRGERLTNVKGAFKINGEVKNQNFIVVDDVITTGATILEAAKTLKVCGADQVRCLTVARD